MDDAVPEAVEVGRLELERMGRQSCRVWGHGAGEALELPKALMDVLGYFGGRPTHEALAAIEYAAGSASTPRWSCDWRTSRSWCRRALGSGPQVPKYSREEEKPW